MDHKEENKSLRTDQSSLEENGNTLGEHTSSEEARNENQKQPETHNPPEIASAQDKLDNQNPEETESSSDDSDNHKEARQSEAPGEENSEAQQEAVESVQQQNEDDGTQQQEADVEEPAEEAELQENQEASQSAEETSSSEDAAEQAQQEEEASKPEATEKDSVESEQQPEQEQPEAKSDTLQQAQSQEQSTEAQTQETQADEQTETGQAAEDEPMEIPDYSIYSKDELVNAFEDLLENYRLNRAKDAMEAIRSTFFKKRNEELEALKEAFQKEGGDPMAFKAPEDVAENKFKELYKKFKDKKKEQERAQEEQKQHNLEASEQIIRKLKELINTKESLGKTFNEFKTLQQRWREIGPVPQNKYKDLWIRYNHSVEQFYDYVKINKELKELDLKKNLEAKRELCEKAEDLLLEDDVVQAYKSLQTLHDRWREIGPVPKEKKDELWERFKAATKQINKRHQEHFEKQKEEREKNLEAKTLLCQKAEELAELEIDTHKEWEERTKEIKQLQEIWRSIGFVPKKYNNKIYKRFRAANDQFFNKKREFYANLRKEQQENLTLKRELLEQAEEMKESTDWKAATEFFKDIQEKWKQIGPVPKKHSDTIWKKFRAACNHFFDRKREHFSKIDQEQEKNLELKRQLIKEVKEFEPLDDDQESLRKVKAFQDRWSEIGFVPIQYKDEVQREFSEAINALYEKLQVDDAKLVNIKYKKKIENLKNAPNAESKLLNEREKIANKLKKVEGDITVWENNIGFFTSNSKNAQSYIDEMNKKIDDAKILVDKLKTKLDIIDEALD